MSWREKKFVFESDHKKQGFSIQVTTKQWKNLPAGLQKKFEKKADGYVFSHSFPLMEASDAGEYCIAERRVLEKTNPSRLDLAQLAEWVKTKKVLFYSGAGISAAAGIPTMFHLNALFQFDQNWLEEAVHSPEKIIRKIEYFHRACFDTSPTKGHWALQSIVKTFGVPILTENLDHLHQKTGILPFCVNAQAVKKEIVPTDLLDVDAVICIGLSFDDKGFLGWYKEICPQGTIISIDFHQPSYLGNEDFWLEGDIQKCYPNSIFS